ncbi:MAG TPA: DUF4350 domain-containing protein [Chitinophagaceae bacterium]|nr:DUF4350 domain-containing protein [Chitinophagaceae bacterium]
MKINIWVIVFVLHCFTLFAQQLPDTNYKPIILHPEYSIGKGSVVYIDEGHHNFHTKDGRYFGFARLLESDGYNVKRYVGLFEEKKLDAGKILVISNALNEINTENWYLPTPSAFTKEEIESVRKWVYNGGSLFLIADHMPLAGSAADLAKVFGFDFRNGFAVDTMSRTTDLFSRNDSSLKNNVITNGRNKSENVQQVATFTGQSFKIPADAESIITLSSKYVNLLPDTAWVFDSKTRIESAEGLSQGAFKKYGKGKLVMFGEAAMFTTQLAGPQQMKVGMNSPIAKENYQLLLNIIHWLDGKL